jgi:hypothetical protein
MLKKYMIFGSVVLLLAALLTMTGCSQATDSDGTTLVIGENHLFGRADQYAVARAVASAKRTGRSVVISDGTILYGNQQNTLPDVADFETLPVRVEGNVWVEGGVIVNAAFANLTFAEGATITVRNRGAFIYQGSDDHIGTEGTTPLNIGYKVRYVTDPLRGTQGTDEHVAISDYTIGVDFKNIAPHITNLYVLKKLTVDAGSIAVPGDGDVITNDNPRVIALGTVALEASNSLVFQNLDQFQFTDSAVLTSTAPSLTLTLIDQTPVLPTIEATVPLTIVGHTDITKLEIAGIKGPDTLTITNGTTGTFIKRLTITEVYEGGKVAVSTGTLGIGNSGVEITKNAGSISLSAAHPTAPLAAKSKIEVGTNTGTITIAAATTNNTVISVADNKGTINFDIPTISGTIEDPATPIYYPGITIAENTGEVNFVRDLTVAVGYGIKAPVNNGAINFYGTFAFTPVVPDPLGDAVPANFARNIAGSGKLVFGGAATFSDSANIDCNMEFNDGFVQAVDTTLGLGGDVTLANGRSITITSDGSDPATTTLKEGKKLLVGTVPVLIGGAGGATIRPSAVASNFLVLAAGVPVPDEEEDLGYKTLTLWDGATAVPPVSTVGIASITGNLRIAGTGLLRNEETINVGTGSLTLEDGAILVFPAAGNVVTFGTGFITAGTTANVEIDAIGGAVTLGPDSISGSGATFGTPEEAPVAGGPVITAGTNPLLIAGVNLDLQFYGSLFIPNAEVVVLEGGTNPGKITLSEDTAATFASSLSGNRIDTDTTDGFSDNDVVLGGSGLLLGDEQGTPCAIGEISGVPGGGRLTITAAGAASATILAGLSVVGPTPTP